jgi:hypothetical protein
VLKEDIEQHLKNYDFLINVLYTQIENTNAALVGNPNWWAFAPKVCQKFFNQAITLKALFANKVLEVGEYGPKPFEDVSTIYTTLRMQFETHGLFFHLFVPTTNWEVNILRFRLWELDGIRTKIAFRLKLNGPTKDPSLDELYLPRVVKSITDLAYYNILDEKRRKFLFDRAAWRFSEQSLREINSNKWQFSYEQLVKNAGIKDEIYGNLYSHFSMHTHPGYIGVVQSMSLDSTELLIAKYVSVLYSCFVTSFMISDLSKRFAQSREHYESLSDNHKDVIQSFLKAGRN